MSAQDIKAFQLLDFETGNKSRNKPLMIECVPSQWISFNPSIGKCQCKFMPPPYSKEDTKLVDTLVKQQGLPPESWPTYTVNLRGHATTYDDAMKRLEVLKVKPYAYTEDDVLPETKATNVTKAYQRLKIKGDQALAKKLMQVQEIVPSTDQHSSTSEEYTESTDENCNIRRSRNHPKHKIESSKRSTSTKDFVQDGKRSQLLSQRSTGNQKDKVKLLGNRRQVDVSEKPKKSRTSQSFAHSSKDPSPPSESRSPEIVDAGMCQTEVLTGLRHDIQALTTAFRELKGVIERSALAQNAFGTNVQSFATEYNVALPMMTTEDFHTFDDRLKMDKKLRKEFASTLHFIVDSHTTLARNITAMLKKHISRDVALKFNAVKSAKDKEIFKETKLCSLFRDVLLLKYKEGAQGTVPITEKNFYRELGTCLSNAIDWDGHRKDRRNNPNERPDQSDAESTDQND